MQSFTTIRQLLNRSSEKLPFDPVRYWLILLAIALVILIGILMWGIGTFNRISIGQTLDDATKMATERKESVSLEEIETIFALRAEETKKYQRGTYTFTDPSL